MPSLTVRAIFCLLIPFSRRLSQLYYDIESLLHEYMLSNLLFIVFILVLFIFVIIVVVILALNKRTRSTVSDSPKQKCDRTLSHQLVDEPPTNKNHLPLNRCISTKRIPLLRQGMRIDMHIRSKGVSDMIPGMSPSEHYRQVMPCSMKDPYPCQCSKRFAPPSVLLGNIHPVT